MPTWLKWTAVVIMLITTLIVPLVLFEDESNTLVNELLAWTGNQPLTTAAVLIGALAADVFLPVPNGVINTLAGSVFGVFLGAVVIWTGLTVGCVLGYGVGRLAGQPLAHRFVGTEGLARAHELAARLGAPTLVLTRTVPIFAELTTLAAGIVGYPFWRFALITALANVGVALVFATIGAAAEEARSAWLAFLGAVALPLLAWTGYRLFTRSGSA